MKKITALLLIAFLLSFINIIRAQENKIPYKIPSNRNILDDNVSVLANVKDDDTWCQASWWTYSWSSYIWFDDGSAEDLVLWQDEGSVNAVRFSPSGYPVNVVGGDIYVGDGSYPGPFLGTSFQMAIYDDDGPGGFPGTLLDSITVSVDSYGWIAFMFPDTAAILTEGDFYLGMKQTNPEPDAAPLGVDMTNPTYNRSYSKFQDNDWGPSVYQDFMIRAYVAPPGEPVPNYDDFEVNRFSNFDPNGSPLLGDTTYIANTSNLHYDDTLWAGLPQGWYAYGLKTHSPDSGWSDYYVSNVVGHFMNFAKDIDIYVTDNISCPNSLWYRIYGGDTLVEVFNAGPGASIHFEGPPGHYYIETSQPGNDSYDAEFVLPSNTYMSIVLGCNKYPVRNLYVDPLSLIASWDSPQATSLIENFETAIFPPSGWQSFSNGSGWFRTTNGSGGGWDIPTWAGTYACSNDRLSGIGNDGSEDRLITPALDLRVSPNFHFDFDSYYDGMNGQQAYIEYSFNDTNWNVLYQLEPSISWQHLSVDLSSLSGCESDPVFLAFHADDNGQEGSGWAIDNPRVFSPDSLLTLQDYYIFLDDEFIGSSETQLILC